MSGDMLGAPRTPTPADIWGGLVRRWSFELYARWEAGLTRGDFVWLKL